MIIIIDCIIFYRLDFMYVCICENITEAQIKEAMEKGARSVNDLHRELAIGKQCGKCICSVRQSVKHFYSEAELELATPA